METEVFWGIVFWVCVWLTYREKRQQADLAHREEMRHRSYMLAEHRRKEKLNAG